jgi:Flp pilus assembly protein TadG
MRMVAWRRADQHPKPRGLRDRPSQRGQGLLEFALVILTLVLVMIGIIDFGRMYFTYATVANAAREGARYGIIYPTCRTAEDCPDPNNITYRTRAMLSLIGGSAEIQITYPDDGCMTPGCRIRVKVSTQFDMWTPLIPRFTIVGESTMYIES